MKRLPLALIAILALTLAACEQKKPEAEMHPIDSNQPTTLSPAGPGPESDPYVSPPAGAGTKYQAPPKSTPPPKAAPSEPASGKSAKGKSAAHGEARTYTVQKGDTLSGIAKKMYGDSTKWKKIYEANRSVIPDPKKLPVGAKLAIP